MVLNCWCTPELVMTDFDRATGLTSWRIGSYRFRWDGATVWCAAETNFLPLLACDHKDFAIQFTVGFVEGRRAPFMAGEVKALRGQL